jgi:multiple sugar transport system substrate-binding protein
MIELRGITWNHTRGFAPLAATAEAFSALNPEITVRWEARTLQQFADQPIEKLAEKFDLLVIDHPFVGFAADDACLLPLDELLEPAFLADQAANSVGASHASYFYGGHQWALAVDAACQVSAYRPDLLHDLGEPVPATWNETISLARRLKQRQAGWVAVPLIPVDSLMSFLSLCANAGEAPFTDPEYVVSRAVGRYALETLATLRELAHPLCLDWNPIKVLERMSTAGDVIYCPLLFGYSNYSRPGFRSHLVRFTNIPASGAAGCAGGILGGTGLAISSRTAHPQEAAAYAGFTASGPVQRGTYFACGGQPGYRGAWTDPVNNAATNDFFLSTLQTLDKSYLRPRYNGYMAVQDRAGLIIHEFLRGDEEPEQTLTLLDELYRDSVKPTRPKAS